MNRLALVTVLAAASLAIAAPAFATAGHSKPWICHPVEGRGETGTGWNLIRPDKASSHINEATGAGKHTRSDGRTDVYAVNGLCPGQPTPSPTTVTPSPTTTRSTPSPSSTTHTPSGTSTSSTHSPTSTASPTSPSPSPTSSTPSASTPPIPTKPVPTSPATTSTPKTTSGSPSSTSPRPSSATATSTTNSPQTSVPSSTDAPPELARTGANLSGAAIVAIFVLALGAILGWFAWALGRNRGQR